MQIGHRGKSQGSNDSRNTLGSGSAWDMVFSTDPDQKFISHTTDS